jgi:hypothetical protein
MYVVLRKKYVGGFSGVQAHNTVTCLPSTRPPKENLSILQKSPLHQLSCSTSLGSASIHTTIITVHGTITIKAIFKQLKSFPSSSNQCQFSLHFPPTISSTTSHTLVVSSLLCPITNTYGCVLTHIFCSAILTSACHRPQPSRLSQRPPPRLSS